METSNIAITVIVPVYNVERYLDECMQSLLGQTLKSMEIILVDDCSPDGSGAICDRYAQQYPNVRVIHKAVNEGPGFARNTGLESARGDYVAFLDADDIVEPDTYRKAYEFAKREDLDMARFRFCRFDDEGHTTGLDLREQAPVLFSGNDNIKRFALEILERPADEPVLCPYDLGSAWGGIYRASMLKVADVKFPRERMHEDVLFNFKLLQHAQRLGAMNQTLYHYRINTSSLSRRLDLTRLKRSEQFVRLMIKLMNELGYPATDEIYAMGYYVGMLRVCVMDVMQSNLPMAEKKRWFRENVKAAYCQHVCSTYPTQRLQLKHRVLHEAIRHGHFWATYLIVILYKKVLRR